MQGAFTKPLTKQQLRSLAVRKWLAISATGEASVLEMAKLRLTHQLGVQLRDLRLLDPQLATSYPSAILARDQAIVLNLEFIKAIVSIDRIYVTNLDDEHTLAFVEALQRRLGIHGGPYSSDVHLVAKDRIFEIEAGANSAVFEELPYELLVLEVALECVSSFLARQTSELEAAAHPALDALTRSISSVSLERVRRLKHHMVRLSTKVETLKEVLEELLGDDEDMKDLHLSGKIRDRDDLAARNALRSMSHFDAPLSQSVGEKSLEFLEASPVNRDTPFRVQSSSASSSSSSGLEDDEDVQEVEQLLEPYFMMNDNTLNKLAALGEYVDDTEDFINIELDYQRNEIFRLDVVLTTFGAAMAMITAVTALFAMNLALGPDLQNVDGPYWVFVTVTAVSCAAAIAFFCAVLHYCRKRRLL